MADMEVRGKSGSQRCRLCEPLPQYTYTFPGVRPDPSEPGAAANGANYMTSIRLPAMLAIALVLCACAPHDPPRAALEQRLQQLEDEKAIREVAIRYGEYLDARDYAAYASLFASDGVWTGGFGSFTGPAAIQQMLEKNLGKPEDGFVNKSNFHLITTVVVDVHGDTAKVRSRYMFFTASPDNRPAPALAGRYIDDFVRENGTWKIKNRITHGVIPYRDGNDPNRPPPPASLNGVTKK